MFPVSSIRTALPPVDATINRSEQQTPSALRTNVTSRALNDTADGPVSRPVAPHVVAPHVVAPQVIAPTSITDLHVLDWDDCIRDKTGMNYELMHNAMTIAANRYGKQHPCLIGLVEAMAEHRGKYVEGMPLLCMDKEAFSHWTMQDTTVTRQDVFADLLSNIGEISPSLAAAFSRVGDTHTTPADVSASAGARVEALTDPLLARIRTEQMTHHHVPRGPQVIGNILLTEFNRHYKQLIRMGEADTTIADQSGIEQPPSSVDRYHQNVPFPNVELTLMPGAMTLLNDLRRPEHFVALFSNRGHGELEQELRKMGLAHYFDEVGGVPECTVVDAAGKTTVQKRYEKPSDARLRELVTVHPHLATSNVTLWGDMSKDLTQAIPLVADNTLAPAQVHAVIVTPNDAIVTKARDLMAAAGITDVRGMPRLYG